MEEHAARELQDYLNRIGGATLPLLRESAFPAGGKALLVGPSRSAAALLPETGLQTLAADEILLRTVDGNVILTGGPDRGTLYAVYEFLERLGVRWWTREDTAVPRLEVVETEPLDIRYAPPLKIREPHYFAANSDPEFASHLRLNGHFFDLPPELGGHDAYIGFVHTFPGLIPKETYFGQHPEWFELRGNERYAEPETAQLCLSNPELRRELTANALARLRQYRDPRLISISQNDSYAEEQGCECPECQALNAYYGSPSGAVLMAVNEAATAIAREYPQVQVDTLAYRYTRTAPHHIQPEPNVIVRLCSIECDLSKPLDAPENAAFRDDFLAWSAIAPQLSIWHYGANYSNALAPFPNLRSQQRDLQFLADHGVVSLFFHGANDTYLADLADLRLWLLSKLMWDPGVDMNALMDEFLNGYYGEAAAPVIREYLELLEDEVAASGRPFTCYQPDTTGWLSLPTLGRALRLMDQLESLVRDGKLEQRRFQRLALPVRFVFLETVMTRPDEVRAHAGSFDRIPGPGEWLPLLEEYSAIVSEYPPVHLREELYINRLRELAQARQ